MSALIHVLTFLNLFAGGILVGSLLFEGLVVVPSLNELPLATSAQMHGILLGHKPDRFMPLAGVTAGITAIALPAIGWHQATSVTAIYAVGAAFGITLLLSTVRISLPMNRVIAGWPVGEPPAEYPKMRRYWDQLHIFRTSCGLIALGCWVSAAVIGLH